ncbi:MAG: PAS domain S-box protein [Bacteroidota bacterium]
MTQFPVPHNEAGRLKALNNYKILDTLNEKEFDRITELAGIICGTPISLVSLIDEKRQWFKSGVGIDISETPRELAFCSHAIMDTSILEVEDATKDSRFSDNPFVTGEAHIRFYAGCPLIDTNGFVLGTLCVIDNEPKSLTETQSKALRLLADEVMTLIAERSRNNELRNFERIVQNSSNLICILNSNGLIEKVNPAFCKLFEYTEAELIGKPVAELIHPADSEAAMACLAAATENAEHFNIRIVTKQGRVCLLNWMSTYEQGSGSRYCIARDITEQDRVEHENRRAQEVLEQTGRMAKVGGWELDWATKDLHWSSVARTILELPEGYQSKLNDGISRYKEGESKALLTQSIEKAVKYGTPYDHEVQLITARGNEVWVRAVGAGELKNGVCKRLFGTLQDIDDKKKAELEISASKRMLNNVLQSASSVCIIAIDLEGIIRLFNAGAEALLGYAAEELIGKHTPAVFHDHDEIKTRIKALSEELGYPVRGIDVFIRKVIINGADCNDWIFVSKTGQRFTVSVNATALKDEAGNITGYLGVAIDKTARLNAERELEMERSRLLAFIEHAPASVAMFDRDIKYLSVSNRWIEDYHLQNRDFIGKSHYEVFPGITDEWKAIHQRCLAGSIETSAEDVWRPDGWDEDQYLRWEVRPWYTNSGEIGGIMIFTQDITDSCMQREELKKAKEHAEMASVAKSEFLAGMSHEIRTPLNGIIGFTDLVLRTTLTETQSDYLGIVNQSANALLGVINDILDFSKIEAGKLELDIEKTDLFELSSQAIDITGFQDQSKGIELLLDTSGGLPRFIHADQVRLKQVLINLLGNAVKFTAKGEVELRITSGPAADSALTRFRFEVRDTGIGIKPEMQDKIFEAFSQEDGSTTRKYGGTGLGLTISNKLLALMNSRLQLLSEPGIGSTFYFDLDLEAEQGEAFENRLPENLKRVLIADDSNHNRHILQQMLKLWNIESVAVSSGLEALHLLSVGETFDAVLMDYQMPVLDGCETIAKIRKNLFPTSAALPVLLLHSASDSEALIRSCKELDVSQRLMKPIKADDLYRSLARLSVDSKQPAPVTEPAESQFNNRKVSILLAEDVLVNVMLVKAILNKIFHNPEITVALNGAEAVAKYKTAKPDIILMDLQMPEMNGYQATKAIRAFGNSAASVPIIALTAGNLKGEREKCIEGGMDDYATKPLVESDLRRIMEKWLTPSEPNNTAADGGSEIPAVLSHFDKAKFSYYASGDKEMMRSLLPIVRAQLNESVTKLEKATSAKNLKAVKSLGHMLYSSCAACGFEVLADIASKMEMAESIEGGPGSQMKSAAISEIRLVVSLIDEELSHEPDFSPVQAA